MKQFLSIGYNSFTNNHNVLITDTKEEAENFTTGLTDAKTYMFTGKTKAECATKALRASIQILLKE